MCDYRVNAGAGLRKRTGCLITIIYSSQDIRVQKILAVKDF